MGEAWKLVLIFSGVKMVNHIYTDQKPFIHSSSHVGLGNMIFIKNIAACSMKIRSEEHTSELQSRENLVCRLLLEKKKKNNTKLINDKKEKKGMLIRISRTKNILSYKQR